MKLHGKHTPLTSIWIAGFCSEEQMLTLQYLLRNASWFLSLMQFDSDTSSSILGPLKRVPLHSTLAAIWDSQLESALPNPSESQSQCICSCKSKVIIFPSSSILSTGSTKAKDNDHIPNGTNDTHRKAVFHESKKQSGIPDTLTNLHV